MPPQRPPRGARAPPGGHPAPPHVPPTGRVSRTREGERSQGRHRPRPSGPPTGTRANCDISHHTRCVRSQENGPEGSRADQAAEDLGQQQRGQGPGPDSTALSKPWVRPGGTVTWQPGQLAGRGRGSRQWIHPVVHVPWAPGPAGSSLGQSWTRHRALLRSRRVITQGVRVPCAHTDGGESGTKSNRGGDKPPVRRIQILFVGGRPAGVWDRVCGLGGGAPSSRQRDPSESPLGEGGVLANTGGQTTKSARTGNRHLVRT